MMITAVDELTSASVLLSFTINKVDTTHFYS